MISINSKEVPLIKLGADVAADLRSVETGRLVTRHAVMIEALRIGLAEILGVHPDEFLDLSERN